MDTIHIHDFTGKVNNEMGEPDFSVRRLNYLAVVHREMLETKYRETVNKLKSDILILRCKYEENVKELKEEYANFLHSYPIAKKGEKPIPLY